MGLGPLGSHHSAVDSSFQSRQDAEGFFLMTRNTCSCIHRLMAMSRPEKKPRSIHSKVGQCVSNFRSKKNDKKKGPWFYRVVRGGSKGRGFPT